MKLQVATTILEQLGGRRFIVMTGAKNFVGDKNSLTFRLPGNAHHGINVVKVELTPLDEYNMTFSRRRGDTLTEVEKLEGVYCDQLQELFTQYTGLYTSL